MSDYLGKLVDQIWPHEEYRDKQRAVVIDALKALYEDEYDYYFISAPTGFGKSPVCLTIAQAGGMIDKQKGTIEERAEAALQNFQANRMEKSGYYVTPQNILLDQLEEDYGDLPIFEMLKGRSHYSCKEDDNSCADGKCRFDNKLRCTRYGAVRDRTLSSPVANTNFVLYMVHPDIERRPMLVADEAHMMPEYVLSQVEVKLREDRLHRYGWQIPEFDQFEKYVSWMKPKAHELTEAIEEMEAQLETQAAMDQIDEKLAKHYEKTKRLKGRFDRLLNDWRYNSEKWVVQHKDEYDGNLGEEVETVLFRPVTPYRFMEGMVFRNGKKAVISSATPPKPDLLGLDGDNAAIVKLDSPFDVENRPCYYDPISKMSSSNRDGAIEDVVDKIDDVAEGNTLIHAHTYDFATKLYGRLQDRFGQMNVTRQESKDREASLEAWKQSKSQYFVSVNMYDGIDLKDDLCRTNIICVVPFPYLGDPQVRKRKEVEGDRFFNWETAMRIQQAYGRSTRSRDDWSNTYILDENFGWFYKQNQDLFFPWFKEAIHWP